MIYAVSGKILASASIFDSIIDFFSSSLLLFFLIRDLMEWLWNPLAHGRRNNIFVCLTDSWYHNFPSQDEQCQRWKQYTPLDSSMNKSWFSCDGTGACAGAGGIAIDVLWYLCVNSYFELNVLFSIGVLLVPMHLLVPIGDAVVVFSALLLLLTMLLVLQLKSLCSLGFWMNW